MGIKVSRGYKIDGNISLNSLANLMEEISIEAKEICNDLYHSEVASFASMFLDFSLVFGEEIARFRVKHKYKYIPSNQSNDLESYIYEITHRDYLSDKIFENRFNFKCSLKVLPIPNKVLFLLDTKKKEYEKLFEENQNIDKNHHRFRNKINPYEFYGAGGLMEGVSIDDWKQREIDWGKALRFNGRGFEYLLLDMPEDYKVEDVLCKIYNNHESRIKLVAERKVLADFIKVYENGKELINQEYYDFIKTKEYSNLLKLTIEQLTSIVPKSYTAEDLKAIRL